MTILPSAQLLMFGSSAGLTGCFHWRWNNMFSRGPMLTAFLTWFRCVGSQALAKQ